MKRTHARSFRRLTHAMTIDDIEFRSIDQLFSFFFFFFLLGQSQKERRELGLCVSLFAIVRPIGCPTFFPLFFFLDPTKKIKEKSSRICQLSPQSSQERSHTATHRDTGRRRTTKAQGDINGKTTVC